MKVKDPNELTHDQLVTIVRSLQEAFWLGGEGWDPDKEWDWEILDWPSVWMGKFGLKPEEV